MPDIINLIQISGNYGYFALFLVIFLESFPVTFFLPGDSLLFTMGFLAFQGALSFPVLIVTLYIAAVLGYIGSYYFGKFLGHRIFSNEKSFWFNPKHLERTRKFYEKYGSKMIIIGRFVPIVRSFSPSLAGAVDMDYRKFLKYVFIGSAVWVVGVSSTGFFLGKFFPNSHLYLTPIILSIVFVSILPGVYEYIKEKRNKLKKTN